jgi:hypothetical protein
LEAGPKKAGNRQEETDRRRPTGGDRQEETGQEETGQEETGQVTGNGLERLDATPKSDLPQAKVARIVSQKGN